MSTNGFAGAAPGGGGGGGSSTISTGGNGGAGKVTLTWSATSVPANSIVRFPLSIPSTGCVNAATILRAVISSGGLTKTECYYGTGGKLGFRGFSGVTSKFDSGLLSFGADGVPMLVSLELKTSGANIAWQIQAVVPGGTSKIQPSGFSGTYTTATMGAISQVVINPGGTINDTAIGMVAVQYALEDLVTSGLADALNGHDGELAGTRFTRLCSEAGIGGTLRGMAVDTPMMGPQRNGKFTDLLQQVEDADRGLLIEARDMLGLYYRTRVNMSNQTIAVTLNYTAAVLAEELSPVPDDSLTRNDVTVTRINGASAHVSLNSGALSTQNPPNGVGDYTYQLDASVHGDAQVQQLAQDVLNKGTVDQQRYPSIVLDMRRTQVESLFASVPGLDGGDHIQLTNIPSFADQATVDQLVFGFDETLNAYTWRIDFNGVPELPYETNFLATAASGSAQNSGFEGGIGTWAATANCAVALDTSHGHTGADSLKMTSTASGDMTAQHCASANFATQMLAVNGGDQVYASAWFRSAVSARACSAGIHWFDASGTTISTVFGSTATDSTSGWTQAAASLTAPSNAAFAQAVTKVAATGAGSEVHYTDDVQLMESW